MAHVSPEKKEVVKHISALLAQYPIVGAVNMENLPAPQLQAMKAQLRGKVELVMTKRRIMKVAIGNSKLNGIEQISKHLVGMPALLFTKENPFSLFRILKKSRSKAPAKAGQIAPYDLVINAGSTPFAPGPIIGELGALGIKTGVESGKVVVKADSTVAKKGDKISQKVADVLSRLDIKPMEVGLSLVAVLEKGVVYTSEILDIDEVVFMGKLMGAARQSVNLSVYAGYPTKDTIRIMIGKAFNDAKAIGLSQNIIDSGIIEELLAKAERGMLSVKREGGIETVEAKRETKKEPKSEEQADDKPKAHEKPAEEAGGKMPAKEDLISNQVVHKPQEKPVKEEKKSPSEHKVVESLAKELVKKGTLRKK